MINNSISLDSFLILHVLFYTFKHIDLWSGSLVYTRLPRSQLQQCFKQTSLITSQSLKRCALKGWDLVPLPIFTDLLRPFLSKKNFCCCCKCVWWSRIPLHLIQWGPLSPFTSMSQPFTTTVLYHPWKCWHHQKDK